MEKKLDSQNISALADELKELLGGSWDEYREVVEYCESRQTGLEGIPAIIGLDDLTDPDRPVYKGAPMDEKLHDQLAMDALLFTWLYSQRDDRDPHYPDVAPAMSAVAERAFMLREGEEKPVQYREVIGETGRK